MTSIAFIHPFIYRFPRGIERYLINLSSALVARGTQTDILTWRWSDPIAWPELDPRVNVLTFPACRYYADIFIVPFYINCLLRKKYDHVFVNFADYGEALALNLLHFFRFKQRYTIVFHFPYSQVPHRYESFVQKGLTDKAERIIAVSDFVADQAQKYLGRSCDVISHGVDTKVFHPDTTKRMLVRDKLEIPETAPILLTVSALEERKGVQWMLRALPLVLDDFSDAIYVIVGEGPYKPRLERLVSEMRLNEHVRFISAKTNVARFYQAADLKIILSVGEASSLVSLEAMACELPVIASLEPPFNELINPEWGRQVDRKNKKSLAKKINQLLSNRNLRKKMGQAGRKRIKKQHTWDRISHQYLDILASIS